VVGSTASPTGMTNPFFGQQPATPPANTTAWQPQPQPQPQQQVPAAAGQFVPASQAPPICLDGYCAVTLLETKKWKKADPQFGAVHRGRTYLFADADQQKKFLANPDGFAPVLSGYDPVRFATTGQLVEGSRAFGVITPGDNRIFLFAAPEIGKCILAASGEPPYADILNNALITAASNWLRAENGAYSRADGARIDVRYTIGSAETEIMHVFFARAEE
jgi:hypothetical protein